MSAGNKFGSSRTKALQVFLGSGLGGLLVQDTNQQNGSFESITVLAAAVARIDGSNLDGDTSAVTLPVGATIYCQFTGIKLASGKVIANYAGK